MMKKGNDKISQYITFFGVLFLFLSKQIVKDTKNSSVTIGTKTSTS